MPELFQDIRLQRFLSHVDTRLRLADRGLVLLSGPNGAGKSACLPDGLLFAAYGETLRGARGAKLVNRNFGENGLVTLTGFDRFETHYTLERPIKHRKKPKVTIKIGAETHTGDVEVERVFRQIVGGCGYDALVAATIFGKGDARFFTQLTDSKRKQILDELMSFADLNRFLDAAKDAVGKVEEEAGEQLREVEVLTARVGELTEQESALEQASENFERMRQQELQTCESLLKADRGALPASNKGVAKVEVAFEKANGLLAEATSELDAAVAEAGTIREAIQTQEKAIAVLETKRDATQEKIEAIIQRIKKAERLSGKSCPTCEQEVSEAFTETCVDHLRAEAEGPKRELIDFEKKIKRAKATKGQLQEAHDGARQDLAAKRSAVTDARTLMETSQRLLNEKRKEVNALELRISLTEAEVARIKARKNESASQLKDVKAKVTTLKEKLLRLSVDAAAIADRKLYYEFWVKAFGNAGIKSLLLDGVTPRLNASAERYSNLLTDGVMRVRFSSNRTLGDGRQKEEFTVEVDVADAAPSYELSSDGQRRRADIIATLALGDIAASRVGVPLNLLVLDEIFDGLDPAGMERAVQLLQHMTNERSSIFCMTHSEAMAGYFPTTIRVERVNGASRLVDFAEQEVA